MSFELNWILEKIEAELKEIIGQEKRLLYLYNIRNKYDTDFWGKDRYEKILRRIDVIIEREKNVVIGDEPDNLKAIPEKYKKFWMQFSNINPKTQKPYLTEQDVYVFLNQAFGNAEIKLTFNPDLNKKELYHAAWLFYNEYKKEFKKIDIADKMKSNFPDKFSGTLDEETEKIRDGLDRSKRIFHTI